MLLAQGTMSTLERACWAGLSCVTSNQEHRTDTSQIPLIRRFRRRLNYQKWASTEIKFAVHLRQNNHIVLCVIGQVSIVFLHMHTHTHTHTHILSYTPLGCSPEATNCREGLSHHCPLPTLCSHSLFTPLHVFFLCLEWPGDSEVKNPPANAEWHMRHGFNPWIGKICWRKKWQPTPVFLPGKSYGQRSLEVYSLWGHEEIIDI